MFNLLNSPTKWSANFWQKWYLVPSSSCSLLQTPPPHPTPSSLLRPTLDEFQDRWMTIQNTQFWSTMCSYLSSWDTYKVFTSFRKCLYPDTPCMSAFITLKRPKIQPQNCWPNVRWAVKSAGLEQWEQPDARLKADDKPKRFSKSNYTKKNIETEKRYYLCWITYVLTVNMSSKECCFLDSLTFWLVLGTLRWEQSMPCSDG